MIHTVPSKYSCLLMVPVLLTAFLPLAAQEGTGSLTREERILGLAKIYSEAKFSFANWDNVPDLDLDAAFEEFIPKVEAAENLREYYHVLKSFIALLKDGHSYVGLPSEVSEGIDMPPLYVQPVEGKAVIVDFAETEEIEQAGISRGLEITKVDGVPVRELLEKDIYPIVSASTPQRLEYYSMRFMLLRDSKGEKVSLEVKDLEGNAREVKLTRNSKETPEELKPEGWDRMPPLQYRELEPGIHYFSLNTMMDMRAVGEFDKIFNSLDTINGIIIDLRRNHGGNSSIGWRIIGRLIDKPIKGFTAHTPQYIPYYRAQSRGRLGEVWYTLTGSTVAARGGKRFLGPVVVLTNAATNSAAEDFLVPLDYAKRAMIVGGKTAGSTGQPLRFELPGGGSGAVCSVRDVYPDGRKFVGVGIIPHVEVYPTQEDIVKGHDRVLEKGLQILKENIKKVE